MTAPHLGHLYSAVIADAYCRWLRLTGETVHLSVGTDEHGLKILQAAESSGISVESYTDDVAEKYSDMFDTFNILYKHKIRTTEQRHQHAVQTFWVNLYLFIVYFQNVKIN